MKAGFTLIEVLLATAIASIAGLLLTNAMFQVQRTRARVDQYTDLFSRAALLQHQLARDISGAFIPVEADLKSTATAQGAKASAKKKSIDKVFYGVNEGGQLGILSFVTNNPMQMYWGEQVGKPQPKIARVVYRLERDKAHKDSYILFRQGNSELDFAKYKGKKIRAYELIDGIKELSVEYVAILEKKQQTEKITETKRAQTQITKKETQKKIERERKTYKEWKIDQKQQEQQKKQNQQVTPLIPHGVIMHVSLWDNDYKRATPFEFVFPIITSLDRSLYPEKKEQPSQTSNPKHRIIPRQQVRNIRRRPHQHHHHRHMHQHRVQTRRYEIVQREKRPQSRIIK